MTLVTPKHHDKNAISLLSFIKTTLTIVATSLLFLTISLNAYAGKKTIRWENNGDADYYVVYWGTAKSTYTCESSAIENVSEFETPNLAAGTYFIAVKAFNQYGNSSDFSEELELTIEPNLPGYTVTLTNNDTIVDESGTTDTLKVALDSQPASSVVIDITINDNGEATISHSSLTFTNSNWDTPQSITATGVNDFLIDGTQISTITFSINDSNSDDTYDPLANQTISISTTDDDIDSDSDGLSDQKEISIGSDPILKDSDGDGFDDGWEVTNGYNPAVLDTDNDGIDDCDEDYDNDGLTNAQEVITGTDFNDRDTDNNGTNDGDEDQDGDGLSNEVEFQMNSNPLVNEIPIPVITESVQTVTEGIIVNLDGSGSTDPDDGIKSYLWEQLQSGTEPIVTISDSDKAVASFSSPTIENGSASFVFRLTITDVADQSISAICAVNVTYENIPPVADAGSLQNRISREIITLDGSLSTDSDGSIESYTWEQSKGRTIEILEADTPKPYFTAPDLAEEEIFTFSLLVKDNEGLSSVDTVSIVIEPEPIQNNTNAPDPLTPDGGNNVSVTPELTASLHTQASATRWQVSTDAGFTSIIMNLVKEETLSSLRVPWLILSDHTSYFWRLRSIDNTKSGSDWSISKSFMTSPAGYDSNDNGTPDILEPDTDIDINQDGIMDNTQAMIKTFKTVDGNKHVGVMTDQNVGEIQSVDAFAKEDISETLNRPDNLLFDLIGYKVSVDTPGNETVVIIYLSEPAPTSAIWYKYDSVSGWVDCSDTTTFNSDRTQISLKTVDGGSGDADGVTNGIIVNHGGLSIPAQKPSPTPVNLDSNESEGGGCFIGSIAP